MLRHKISAVLHPRADAIRNLADPSRSEWIETPDPVAPGVSSSTIVLVISPRLVRWRTYEWNYCEDIEWGSFPQHYPRVWITLVSNGVSIASTKM